MTMSPIPTNEPDSLAPTELFGTCYAKVEELRSLHFCDADLPDLLIEAADFWDMGLIAAGERNLSNSLDLARPLRSAARLLERLPQVDVAQLLRHDLEAAAWDLEKLTADEAYNYSRYARDAFEPARLQEIDAAFDRFSWVNETENAKQLVPDLFEIAARTLPIGDLFSFGASVETRETWLRDAVASLPDYAARRDDMDDWLPILRHQGDDSVKWPSNRNKVLFDLLAKRGLRRVGHQSLKLRNVAGAIKYGSSSPQYEHHAGFAETDWVWLIETTGAPQIFFADPANPRLEDAKRREFADRAAYNESAFARQQDELAQKRAAKRAKRRLEQDTWDQEKLREQKKPVSAPSIGVMARIRGWLDK